MKRPRAYAAATMPNAAVALCPHGRLMPSNKPSHIRHKLPNVSNTDMARLLFARNVSTVTNGSVTPSHKRLLKWFMRFARIADFRAKKMHRALWPRVGKIVCDDRENLRQILPLIQFEFDI